MMDILLKNFGGVVEYKNWFHTDARSGRKMYIDMRHLDVPENKLSCADFEYSTVKLISIVKKNDVNGNYYQSISMLYSIYDSLKIMCKI